METATQRKPKMQGEQLISAAQVALAYGVDETTVWRWAKLGRIPQPVIRRRKFTRWRNTEVQAHVEMMLQQEMAQT